MCLYQCEKRLAEQAVNQTVSGMLPQLMHGSKLRMVGFQNFARSSNQPVSMPPRWAKWATPEAVPVIPVSSSTSP
jgi:hypothetical protein